MATTAKVITCRAAVVWGPNLPLCVETIQVSPPKAGEVRVKIVATGICRSDAHAMGGHSIGGGFPMILGHEAAGIVESVGEGVTKFKVGDHVIPLYMPQCGECKACKHPRTNFCLKVRDTQRKGLMPDGTTRFTCNGKQVYHFMGTSTFSEYTVVADISLCKVNDKADLKKICLIGCGIPTGYGAAMNTAKVEPGSVCAIWGLGAIGLAAAMGCRAAGAKKVYGIDINPDKFQIATKFGCTDFINPKDYEGKRIQDVLIEMTGGGFDYTFECIGNTEIMRQAFESTNPYWGISVVIGLAPSDQEIKTNPINLIGGRTWRGTAFGGYKSVDSVPGLVEDYLSKKLSVDDFITHKMGLDKINEAFDLMLSGKSIRSVVEF